MLSPNSSRISGRDEAGRGLLLFISLERADFDRLASEAMERAFKLKSGFRGHELAIIEDPDGNRLWFPKPSNEAANS